MQEKDKQGQGGQTDIGKRGGQGQDEVGKQGGQGGQTGGMGGQPDKSKQGQSPDR